MPRGPPPASKEEVAKLPIVEVTKEFLERVEEDTECAVCREDLVLGDKLQEMPCKHNFHPACLKPWLVGSNISLCPSSLLSSLWQNYFSLRFDSWCGQLSGIK